MTPIRRSLLELNLSVVILGMVPLFAKWIPMDPVSLIGWRAVIGAIALLGFYLIRRSPVALASARDYVLMAVLGVVMAVHWSAYFHAIQISTVAIAVVSMFTWPVITVLIEPLFFGGRPRARDVGLGAVAALGVALVMPELSWHSAAVHGVAWGLFAALLFAVRNVVHRRWLSHYPGTLSMGYQLVVVALCLMPFARTPALDAGRTWALLVVLAVVFTAYAHSLFVGSMRNLKAKTAGMISCLQPVYGIGLAALLLGEIPTWHGVAGGILVVLVAAAETVSAPGEARRAAAERREDALPSAEPGGCGTHRRSW